MSEKEESWAPVHIKVTGYTGSNAICGWENPEHYEGIEDLLSEYALQVEQRTHYCGPCKALFLRMQKTAMELRNKSPYSKPTTTTALKFDDGKPRTDLLPADALLGAATAFGYGSKKYADWNYLNGLPWGKALGAALRHLFAWALGEDIDDGPKGSGLPHIDLAAAEVLMLSAMVKRRRGVDDRWKP